ncbi:hypothetical protein B4U80_11990, partial [Leptotrombidium deliense]
MNQIRDLISNTAVHVARSLLPEVSMASPVKPLHLAKSFKELLHMVDNGILVMNNADTLVGCYMSANKSMVEGDQELAFILFKRALKKYSQETFDKSIISEKDIAECRDQINFLTKSLQERYAERKKNDATHARKDKALKGARNAVVPENSINIRNASTELSEQVFRSIFGKYGKIKSCWFKVKDGHGHGVVEFNSSEAAKNAIQIENG